MKLGMCLEKTICCITLITLAAIATNPEIVAAELPNACMHSVRQDGAVLAAARAYLSDVGSDASKLIELRIDDLVLGGQFSLVIVGTLNTPVTEAVVLREQAPDERSHARFGKSQRYIGPSAALAASGLAPDLVDSCRLVRVQAPPWGSDYTPLWEIRAGDASRLIDQSGKRVDRTIESLLRRGRGGGHGDNSPAH
jgi:hypothetical protein